MPDRLDELDYYTLLGVEPGASIGEVKRAFRNFARRYHPDRFAAAPSEKVERANQIYRRGSEAYQVLTHPVSRRAYDAALEEGRVRMTAEERDRAIAEAEAPKKQKGQEDPIRSPQARAFYNKAVVAWKAGDPRGAWKALQTALEHEPGNPTLKKRIAKVEAAIRRMG